VKTKDSYKHIFFDLDHTLWDYERSARETLAELYKHYSFSSILNMDVLEFQKQFFRVNYALWEDYNVGKIDSQFLRENRFKLIFQNLGIDPRHVPEGLGEEYVTSCPQKPYVMDGAFEILDYLKSNYKLHIITNGFEDVQWVKLEKSGLAPYFEEVVTSERAGSKKPSPQIFQFAFDLTGAKSANSLMVGDNLTSDILGARQVSLDHIFYNPQKAVHVEKVTLEIAHLLELNAWL
jgi:putative hydrolase of the HAD superfamily